DRLGQHDTQRGQLDNDSQDYPVVSRSGGDPLLGARHGVAKPTNAPNMQPAFVEQGIIDDEFDNALEGEVSENEDGEANAKARGSPGRAFKEVVLRVEAVTLGIIM